MTLNSSSPFALTDTAVLFELILSGILFSPLRAALCLNPSASEVGVSIPIHRWNWRVDVNEMNDRIDLPSLSSFFVEGEVSTLASFRYTKLMMNSKLLLLFSKTDLPSLESVHLGDGSFRSTPRVEMISEDETII